MKKMYFKKSMSVFLACLMLLSSWVWVAPEHAEAVAGSVAPSVWTAVHNGAGARGNASYIVVCSDGDADCTTVGLMKFPVSDIPDGVGSTLKIVSSNHKGTLANSTVEVIPVDPDKYPAIGNTVYQDSSIFSAVFKSSNYTGTVAANDVYSYFGVTSGDSLGTIAQSKENSSFNITNLVNTAKSNGQSEICFLFVMPKSYADTNTDSWSDIRIMTTSSIVYADISELKSKIEAYEGYFTNGTFYTNLLNNYKAYNDAKRYYDAVTYGGVEYDAATAQGYMDAIDTAIANTGYNETYVDYLNAPVTSRNSTTIGAEYRKNVIWYPWDFSWDITSDSAKYEIQDTRFYWTMPNIIVGITDDSDTTFPLHTFFWTDSGSRYVRYIIAGSSVDGKTGDTDVAGNSDFSAENWRVSLYANGHTVSNWASGDTGWGDWIYENGYDSSKSIDSFEDNSNNLAYSQPWIYQASTYAKIDKTAVGLSASNPYKQINTGFTFGTANSANDGTTKYISKYASTSGRNGYVYAVYMQKYKDNYQNWKNLIPGLSYEDYDGYVYNNATSVTSNLDTASAQFLNLELDSESERSSDISSKVQTWATKVNTGATALESAAAAGTTRITNKYVDLINAISNADAIIAGGKEKYNYASWYLFENAYNAARNHMAGLSPAGTNNQYSTDATAIGNLATELANAQAALVKRNYEISYENLFSFADWANSASSCYYDATGNYVTDIPAGRLTITAPADVAEKTTDCSYGAHEESKYAFPVTGGQNYKIEYKSEGTGNTQLLIFWYDENGANLGNSNQTATGSGEHEATFSAPANAAMAEVRFGNETPGSTVTFYDIAVYDESRATAVGLDSWTSIPIRNSYTVGDTVGTLAEPSRTAYTFDGWYYDKACTNAVSAGDTITESKVVYSKWTPTQYTITYELDGGTITSSAGAYTESTYTIEDNLILPGAEKAGYTFGGWLIKDADGLLGTINGQTFGAGDYGANLYGNATMVAQWTADSFTVTWEYADGTTTTETYSYGATPTAPTNTSAYNDAAGHHTFAWPAISFVTGDVTYKETESIGNHTPGAAATCTSAQVCTVCGLELAAALGHDFKTTNEAKINGDYTHSYKCTDCGVYGTGTRAQGNATEDGKESCSAYYGDIYYIVSGGQEGKHRQICSVCQQNSAESDHAWNDGVITTNPTCTTKGEKTFTCTANGCGATYTSPLDEAAHEWTRESGVVKSAGTCTAEAVYYYGCANCDAIANDSVANGTYTGEKDANNHTGTATVVKNKEDKTCTTDGYTGDTYWSCCDVLYASGETIPAGHEWSTWAWDGTNEYHSRTCSLCQGTEQENHSFTTKDPRPMSGSSTFHNYQCDVCTARGVKLNGVDKMYAGESCYGEGVTYTYDDNNHTALCICGRTNTAAHNWVEDTEKRIEPTCTTDGSKTSTCDICKATKTETLPAAHTFGGWVEEIPANCADEGTKGHYECSACHKYFADDKVTEITDLTIATVAENHKNLVKKVAVDATCTDDGNIEYWYCDGCDKYYSDENATTKITQAETVIEKINHKNKVHHEKVDATCIAEGTIEYWSCPDCKKNFSDEGCTTEVTNLTIEIDGSKHTKLVKTDAVEETCTTDGNIEYWTCEGCKKVYTDENGTTEITDENGDGFKNADDAVIPATGHSYKYRSTNDGKHIVTCENCNYNETEACVDTDGDGDCRCDKCGYEMTHKWSNWTKVDETNHTRSCSECSAVETVEHTDFSSAVTNPTCTEQGYTTHTCEDCGYSYDDTYTDPLGHSVATWTKADENNHSGECTVCHETITESHDGGEASCTEAKKCTVCDDYYGSADGHQPVYHNANDATCEETGNYEYWYCPVCEEYFEDEECTKQTTLEALTIPAKDHKWGDWTTENGTHTRVCENDTAHVDSAACSDVTSDNDCLCDVCGVLVKHIPAQAVEENRKEPNCGEAGSYDSVVYCSVCNAEISREEDIVIPATGKHSYGKFIHDEGEETHTKTCSVCGDKETAACVAEANYTIDVNATCMEEGSKHKDCVDCGRLMETAVIEKIAHNFSGEAVYKEYGNHHYACQNLLDTDGNKCGTYGAVVNGVHTAGETEACSGGTATCTEFAECAKCHEKYGELKEHNFVSGSIVDADGNSTLKTEANCEDDAVYYMTCSACHVSAKEIENSKTWTQTGTAKGHDFSAENSRIHALSDGKHNWKCSKCDAYGIVENGVQKKDGSVDCSFNNSYNYKDDTHHTAACLCGNTKDAEHTASKEATCTTPAHCNICASDYGTALGHEMQKTEASEANCTDDGNIAYYTCQRCNKLYLDEKGENETNAKDVVVPALGHDYDVNNDGKVDENDGEITTEPTCDTEGVRTFTCQNDGSHTYTESVAALEHAYSDFVSDNNATCTADGTKTATCSRCDSTVTLEDIGTALGHNFTGEINPVTDATHNFKCSDCDAYGTGTREDGNAVLNGVVACDFTNSYAKKNTDKHTAYCECGNSKEEEHNWPADGVINPDSTCTQEGTETFTCTECQETKTEVVEMKPHTEGEAVIENEEDPDCENDGSYDTVVYCTVCDKELSRKTTVVPALGHTEGEPKIENNVNPDCENAGSYDTVVYCTVCGDELSRVKTVVPALGHKDADPYDGKCDVCGEDICKHEDTTETARKEATCLAEGNIKYWTCNICSKKFSDAELKTVVTDAQIVIAKKEHSYTGAVQSNGNGETATHSFLCVNGCNKYGGEEKHNWDNGNVTTEPTCEETGIRTFTCNENGCGGTYTAIVPAKGHSVVATAAKAETCTTEGNIAYWTCSVCSKVFTDKDATAEIEDKNNDGKKDALDAVIAALGHDFTENISSFNNGTHDYKCSRCDVRGAVVDGVHTVGATENCTAKTSVVTAPTCTTVGYTTNTCECGHEWKSDEKPVLGHDWTVWTYNAETDKHERSCKREDCNATESGDCADTNKDDCLCDLCSHQLDHTWGDWEVVTAPTCTEKGEEKRTCEICSKEETQEKDALGHTEGKAVIENNVDPDCVNTGSYDTVVYCTVCKEELSRVETIVPALDHNAGEWFVTQKASCTDNGSKELRCTRVKGDSTCGHVLETAVIDACTHSMGEWVYASEEDQPTYTSSGKQTRYCKNTTETDEYLACSYSEIQTVPDLDDTTPAEGKISFEGGAWNEFLNTISFGIFVNYDVEIEITAEDEETNITSIEYYVSEKAMTLDDIKAHTDWTKYDAADKFTVSKADSKQYVVYAKIVNGDGDVTYISTNGFTFDTTAPVLTIEAEYGDTVNNIYCSPVTVKVTEANLANAIFDNNNVALGTNGFWCNTPGEHTLTVTDMAGNSTTVTFTVNADHTGGEAGVENKVDSTCTATGSYDSVIYCTVCGEEVSRTTIEIPMKPHTEGEAVIENEEDPDCENDGSYDTVVYCTVCDKELSRETTKVDALGHTEGEAVIENNVNPTCETAGSYDTVVYCTVCDKELSRVTTKVDALGHTEGDEVIENNVNPDCENDGSYDTVVYCTVCKKELSRVETIVPALGHTEGEPKIENNVEPDCVNDGSYDTVVYCTVCDKELSRETTVVPALGHTEAEPKIENNVEPDCENDGSYDTVVYCTVCKKELSRVETVVPALGHTEGEAVKENIVDAACTANSSYDSVVYCSVCGEELSRETIIVPGTGHTEVVDKGFDATCVNDGKTDGKHCSVCGEITVPQQSIPAKGHSYIDHEAKAPTCDEIGWEAYRTCSACDFTSYREIPALGHTRGEEVIENEVEADCENGGSYDVVVYCTVCGEELSRHPQTIPATGHTWSQWKTVSGDCVSGITLERYCVNGCGKKETKQVSGENHVYPTDENGNPIYDNIVAPTCTQDGYYTFGCVLCGEEGRITAATPGFEEILKATGHDFGEWVVEHEPTCFRNGSKYRVCANGCGTSCGLTKDSKEIAIIPATNHKGSWTTVAAKAATCDEEGHSEYLLCSKCGFVQGKTDIPALGHADSDGDGKCDSCKNSMSYSGKDDCLCHSTNWFLKIIYKIIRFFWKLFGINRVCDCGAVHF